MTRVVCVAQGMAAGNNRSRTRSACPPNLLDRDRAMEEYEARNAINGLIISAEGRWCRITPRATFFSLVTRRRASCRCPPTKTRTEPAPKAAIWAGAEADRAAPRIAAQGQRQDISDRGGRWQRRGPRSRAGFLQACHRWNCLVSGDDRLRRCRYWICSCAEVYHATSARDQEVLSQHAIPKRISPNCTYVVWDGIPRRRSNGLLASYSMLQRDDTASAERPRRPHLLASIRFSLRVQLIIWLCNLHYLLLS